MTVELVTGHSGSAHISGEDVGNLLAGTAGPDCYVLGDQPVPQMRTANLLSIPACDLLIQGRHVRLTGSNTVGIDSGTQTGKRADLVYLEYSMDESTGVEKVSDLMVAKGAAGTSASDPSLPHTGSILDAGNPVDVAVARVTLDGLTPKAELLLPVLPSIASLGDSVSQTAARVPGRVFVGTVVSTVDSSSTPSGHEARLFTKEEFKANFGRYFDNSADYIAAMNADGAASISYFHSVTYFPASGNIWVGTPGVANGVQVRLNYLVVLGY